MTAEITLNPGLTGATIETDTRICRLPGHNPRTLTPWASEEELVAFAQSIALDPRYMLLKAAPSPTNPRDALLAAINAKAAALLGAGYPVSHEGQTYHVALDDGARADLTAMATTAIAAVAGSVPWPQSYQSGWITFENVRIPLAAPETGLALAAGAGDHYARIIQNRRDLKDAALAAADEAALAAIDPESGWPQ